MTLWIHINHHWIGMCLIYILPTDMGDFPSPTSNNFDVSNGQSMDASISFFFSWHCLLFPKYQRTISFQICFKQKLIFKSISGFLIFHDILLIMTRFIFPSKCHVRWEGVILDPQKHMMSDCCWDINYENSNCRS